MISELSRHQALRTGTCVSSTLVAHDQHTQQCNVNVTWQRSTDRTIVHMRQLETGARGVEDDVDLCHLVSGLDADTGDLLSCIEPNDTFYTRGVQIQ
jgi:hypothetical protein